MALWSGQTNSTTGTTTQQDDSQGGGGYYDWMQSEANNQPGQQGGSGGGDASGGGQQAAPQPGGSQTPVTATGQISSQYSTPASYYGQGYQQGQQGTARVGAAPSNKTDYAVADAYETIARAYRDQLGREPSSEEVWGHIRNQGWKPGDRWVGANGLNAVLNGIYNSEEAVNRRNQPAAQETPAAATNTTVTTTQTITPDTTFIDPGPTPASAPAQVNTGGTVATGDPGPTNAGGGGGGGNDWTSRINAIAGQFGKYSPYQFTQFTPPDQSQYTNQVQSALSNALKNSEWSPERIAAMKETQKEQALGMQKQSQQQMGDQMAARGRGQSGMALANQRRLGDATQGQILGSYRDINEQAAQNRRQELLTTSAALEQALTGQMGRAAQGYTTQLAGQGSQADENFRGFESQFTPYELGLKQVLGQEGIGVDWGKINESGREYNLGHDLAKQELAERIRQFNLGLGLDYGKLNASLLTGGGIL